MHDHYDHNQTLVPQSFLVLHSRNGRALQPRAEIEARHELCEDVALHAAAFLSGRHQEGDDAGEALRVLATEVGRRGAPAEAAWVVRRVAELLDWPQPDWLPDAGSDGDRSGRP